MMRSVVRGLQLAALCVVCWAWREEGRGAPGLPPTCDTECRLNKGPFLDILGPSAGDCFSFKDPTCDACNHGTNKFLCENTILPAGTFCKNDPLGMFTGKIFYVLPGNLPGCTPYCLEGGTVGAIGKEVRVHPDAMQLPAIPVNVLVCSTTP